MTSEQRTFIDVFGGCGGLSLGLMQAGWKGLFAIEADRFAFDTLKSNLASDNCKYEYAWPSWLEKEPCEVSRFIKDHADELRKLSGKVTLIAGGPPCQGFSLAGRRKKNDPRNRLFRHYLEIVSIVKPPLLLFENVRGVAVEFGKKARAGNRRGRPATSFSAKIQSKLDGMGYKVFPTLVRASQYGVPQFRPRYIMIAVRKELLPANEEYTPFAKLEKTRERFLKKKKLPLSRAIGVKAAISDLEHAKAKFVACEDTEGYLRIDYKKPRTHFQRLLHGSMNGTAPDSMRIIKHTDVVKKRFKKILATCRRGVQLNGKDRKRFGLNKHVTVPLDPKKACHTLTSLPDDVLHYSEPRILTVREYARLQTFPDWYGFKGKYSTGGNKRMRECPRYTQVANAVPPFLAEILGLLLKGVAGEIDPKRSKSGTQRRTGR